MSKITGNLLVELIGNTKDGFMVIISKNENKKRFLFTEESKAITFFNIIINN